MRTSFFFIQFVFTDLTMSIVANSMSRFIAFTSNKFDPEKSAFSVYSGFTAGSLLI